MRGQYTFAALVCAALWTATAEAQVVFNVTSYLGNGTDIAVGDVNEDGFPDLLTGNRLAPQKGEVYLYINDGQGGLLPRVKPSPFYEFPEDVKLLDINGDGHLDIVVAAEVSFQFQLGNGDGTFGPLDGTNVEGHVIVPSTDCAGSSQRAVLVVSQKPFRCAVWNGSSFNFPIISAQPEGTVDAADAGDLDGDGLNDVVTAFASGGVVQVFKNTGTGIMSLLQSYPTGTSGQSIALGDLNGDGLLDIASGGREGVFVKFNTGGGAFNGPLTVFPAGGVVRSLAIHDMNGDGARDVVVGFDDVPAVNVLTNDGTGQLSLNGSTFVNTGATLVGVGLFDDDTLPDVATVGIFGDFFVNVLLQPPAGIPPVANAGPDQTHATQPTDAVSVTLDGTASTGSDLTYAWFDVTCNTAVPIGSSAQLAISVSGLGDHRFRLVATNGLGESTDEMIVRLTLPNGHVPPGQQGHLCTP
jgi:hypothetical protein